MSIDIKTIGLAAKDIILGAGAAAAGASGGPAAAEGVGKVGTGLDKILGMAGVTESRGDKFDRADFAARPPAQKGAAPAEQKQVAAAPPPPAVNAPAPAPAPVEAREAAPDVKPSEGPYSGDTKLTVDHLRGLGWSHEKIQQILSGPENTSLAAVVAKETKGFRARGVAGTPLPQVDGTPLPVKGGRAVAMADGQAVPSVRGVRAKDTGSDRA